MTYVINNRIPLFPINEDYPDRSQCEKRIQDLFQVWLKEKIISNLARRKACSQVYDFCSWLKFEKKIIEYLPEMAFVNWCESMEITPLLTLNDFFSYARNRFPELAWKENKDSES